MQFNSQWSRDEVKHELLEIATQFLFTQSNGVFNFDSIYDLTQFIEKYDASNIAHFNKTHVFCFGLLCAHTNIYAHNALTLIINAIVTALTDPDKNLISILWDVVAREPIVTREPITNTL